MTSRASLADVISKRVLPVRYAYSTPAVFDSYGARGSVLAFLFVRIRTSVWDVLLPDASTGTMSTERPESMASKTLDNSSELGQQASAGVRGHNTTSLGTTIAVVAPPSQEPLRRFATSVTRRQLSGSHGGGGGGGGKRLQRLSPESASSPRRRQIGDSGRSSTPIPRYESK